MLDWLNIRTLQETQFCNTSRKSNNRKWLTLNVQEFTPTLMSIFNPLFKQDSYGVPCNFVVPTGLLLATFTKYSMTGVIVISKFPKLISNTSTVYFVTNFITQQRIIRIEAF